MHTDDISIIALQSAALRIENIVEKRIIDDPAFVGQLAATAQRLRREIAILQLNQQKNL